VDGDLRSLLYGFYMFPKESFERGSLFAVPAARDIFALRQKRYSDFVGSILRSAQRYICFANVAVARLTPRYYSGKSHGDCLFNSRGARIKLRRNKTASQ